MVELCCEGTIGYNPEAHHGESSPPLQSGPVCAATALKSTAAARSTTATAQRKCIILQLVILIGWQARAFYIRRRGQRGSGRGRWLGGRRGRHLGWLACRVILCLVI